MPRRQIRAVSVVPSRTGSRCVCVARAAPVPEKGRVLQLMPQDKNFPGCGGNGGARERCTAIGRERAMRAGKGGPTRVSCRPRPDAAAGSALP